MLAYARGSKILKNLLIIFTCFFPLAAPNKRLVRDYKDSPNLNVQALCDKKFCCGTVTKWHAESVPQFEKEKDFSRCIFIGATLLFHPKRYRIIFLK